MKRQKIAFDFSNLHILETYLIEAYRGALLFAMENDWEVVYRDCYFGPNYTGVDYDKLTDESIDGIIFDYISALDAEKISESGILGVNIGGMSFDGKFAAVHQDDNEIGQLGARHLFDCFFDNLAFFGTEGKISRRRQQGFSTSVDDVGKSLFSFIGQFDASVYLSYTDWKTHFKNREQFSQWLKKLPKPVGVMCYHDSLAWVTMNCCKELGIKVPEEVAIIGVQEFPLLSYSPLQSLTSIDHSAQESGYQAAKLLNSILLGDEIDETQIYVSPKGIVQRESTNTCAVSHPVVRKAYEFIRKNFASQITIDDVAKAAGTSRATLNRHYPVVMRRTVAEAIRKCRLERGRKLLTDSSFSLKEIASLCGFTDASHFSNLFLKEQGMRPGQWRITH